MKKFTKTKLGAFILLFFTLLFVCCGHYSEENLNVLGQIFKEIEIQNERINEQNEDLHNTIANYAKVREGRWIGHDRTAKEIRKKSAVFFDRIQEIKRTITAHLMIDDPSLEKFSEMDQGEKLDLIFFNASGLTIEGKEFLELMNNYRIRVIQVFASQYPEYTEVVEERFFVGDFEGNGLNSNNQSQSWLSHNFKNQPLIASLAKLTLIQNNIRLVEWDVSNALYSNTLLLYFGYKVDEKTYLLPESSVEEFLLTYPEAKRLDYDSIINSTILGVDAIYLDDSTNILIVVVILFILVIIYINRKKKTPVSKPIEKKKSSDSGPLLFKASIEGFIEKMKEIPDWYQIIQARGNGHAMMVDIGIKVDDYEYWANAHKEEYMIKHDNGDLDVEGINLRIEKFRFIATELEKVIKRASELSLNITTEMANDYHAARASVLGAENALKEMSPKSIDAKKNENHESETSIIRVNQDDTKDIGDITHYEGKPFNGIGFILHENGELKLDCTFKDGLKHGKTVEFYDNGQIKYEYTNVDDEFDKIISAFLENGEKKPFVLSTLKSRKRLTYVVRSEENGEDVQDEIESVSSALGFTDEFYKLNDWEQIKALTEAFKKAKDEKIFGTWVVNEFRFMEYSFKNEFKIKFAEQLIKFYQDDLSIKQLKEYFDNNVIWKDK